MSPREIYFDCAIDSLAELGFSQWFGIDTGLILGHRNDSGLCVFPVFGDVENPGFAIFFGRIWEPYDPETGAYPLDFETFLLSNLLDAFLGNEGGGSFHGVWDRNCGYQAQIENMVRRIVEVLPRLNERLTRSEIERIENDGSKHSVGYLKESREKIFGYPFRPKNSSFDLSD